MAVASERTREFGEVCSFLGAAQRAPALPPAVAAAGAAAGAAAAGKESAVASLADFHGAASSISAEIHTTAQKLGELTKLVTQSSATLFNDPSEQVADHKCRAWVYIG
jgi:hypothetical protein